MEHRDFLEKVVLISRPTERLGATSGQVVFDPTWDETTIREKFSGTLAHGLIPGEEKRVLLVDINGRQLPLPRMAPKGPFEVVTSQGVQFSYELEPWVAALDNLIALQTKDASLYGAAKKCSSKLYESLSTLIQRRVMRAPTSPGFQGIALCGDSNLEDWEVGIAHQDAMSLLESCFAERGGNSRIVRAKIMARIKREDPELWTCLQQFSDEGDELSVRKIIHENRPHLADLLDGLPIWVVRYPSTKVPIMTLKVIHSAPGSGLFITTNTIKSLFQGDYDGDFLFLTLVGKLRGDGKAKSLASDPIVWRDVLEVQPTEYKLRLGRDLSRRMKKNEPINGEGLDISLDKLSIMLGFEQRNWVGMLTYYAWHLYWVACNRCGVASLPFETFFDQAAQGQIPGDPNLGFVGTSNRQWAEKAFSVVVWLLESCFDARKIKDTQLSAKLSVCIIACLQGDMPVEGEVSETLAAAYKELDIEEEIAPALALLHDVQSVQGGAALCLRDVYNGTGLSAVWTHLVSNRSNPDSIAELLREASSLEKPVYDWIMDELSFEQLAHRRVSRETEEEASQRPRLQPFRLEDLPAPNAAWFEDPKLTGELTQAEYKELSPRLLEEQLILKLQLMGFEVYLEDTKIIAEMEDKTQCNLQLVSETSTKGEISYALLLTVDALDRNLQPITKGGRPTTVMGKIPVPKVTLLPKSYRGGAPFAAQVITAREGRFLFRPRLSNIHLRGGLKEAISAGPVAVAQAINKSVILEDGARRGPWKVLCFEEMYAESVVTAISSLMSNRGLLRCPTSMQLVSRVQEPVQKFLGELPRIKGLNQIRVMADEIELDFRFRTMPQTHSQAIKAMLWAKLVTLGYDPVVTSKSRNGTVAGYSGGRHAPLWMAPINPLTAVSRQQRVFRELKSIWAQALRFIHPDAGKLRVINEEHGLWKEFDKRGIEAFVCYADTTSTTLLENGKITSPDQGKTMPAGFEKLTAYEPLVAHYPVGLQTDEELLALIEEEHPGAQIEEVLRATGAGWRRTIRAIYEDFRPGDGIFKVVNSTGVVKFMTCPTNQQWYARVGERIVPIELLASAQSVEDKDAQVEVLRGAMSLVSSFEEPWIVPDNLDIKRIQELDTKVRARLLTEGIVDSEGNPSGRVPVYSAPIATEEYYLGDFVCGYQLVVRTPHDDKVSTKCKGIKHDPHVRHLGDIPFYRSKGDEQQVNRFVNLIRLLEEDANFEADIEGDFDFEEDDEIE
jgi:hypothetical protein